MPSSGVPGSREPRGNTPRPPIPKLGSERRTVRTGGRGAGGRAPLRRELCRGQPDGGEEQDTADQLPHTQPPRKCEGRRAVSRPHIAKSDVRICQAASTRSATIRTASPPPTTWRNPPATRNRLAALP